MPTATTPVVLYVYRCTVCGHADKLNLPETSPEVTAACSACGAEVLVELDGGVELATNQS